MPTFPALSIELRCPAAAGKLYEGNEVNQNFVSCYELFESEGKLEMLM